jgi:conjugal transfer/entry exclusion protein
MDNELKVMLKTVIQEALEPINKRLDQIESNMATKQELQDTRSEMKSRFDTLETKLSHVEDHVGTIKVIVDRMAAETPEDVRGMLKQINAKLDINRDLAHKVDDLEMDLKIIKKAISHQ